MIPGPHRCVGLYNSPGAWPLVLDFLPRYAGLENQVTAKTWSNRANVLVTSRWFWGGGWLRAPLWSVPGGLHDAGVGQAEKMLNGHLGSVLD